DGAAALGERGRRFSSLTIFDSGIAALRSISCPAVAGGMCRTQHRRCPQEHRLRWSPGAASMRRREPNLPATSLPSHVGERSFGGLAGCPNAAQPELQIVSTPLLGLAVGDGKGAGGGCPRGHRAREVWVTVKAV